MIKTIKKILFIVLFLVLLAIGIYLANNAVSTDVDLTYTQFLEKMDNFEIQTAYYGIENAVIRGVLKDGTTFSTLNPQLNSLRLTMLEHDIYVTSASNEERILVLYIIVSTLVSAFLFVKLYINDEDRYEHLKRKECF